MQGKYELDNPDLTDMERLEIESVVDALKSESQPGAGLDELLKSLQMGAGQGAMPAPGGAITDAEREAMAQQQRAQRSVVPSAASSRPVPKPQPANRQGATEMLLQRLRAPQPQPAQRPPAQASDLSSALLGVGPFAQPRLPSIAPNTGPAPLLPRR